MNVIRDFDLNEWRSMSSTEQEMAALSAGQKIREWEAEYDTAVNRTQNLDDRLELAYHRRDLHARRCELSIAILRDDGQGLSAAKLEQIADVIWPRLEDSTQKPTVLAGQSPANTDIPLASPLLDRQLSANSEPDFYITPTWGEKRGYQLVLQARNMILEIVRVAGGTVTWGELLEREFDDWHSKANLFCAKFSND